MSLQFYAPATKSGIIDLIYSNTGADATKYPLIEVTRDVNLALDKAIDLAIKACGKAQFDDTSHTLLFILIWYQDKEIIPQLQTNKVI